jgi:hypothetical protein
MGNHSRHKTSIKNDMLLKIIINKIIMISYSKNIKYIGFMALDLQKIMMK